MSGEHIGIVGGGLAGIAAALTAVDGGADVTLLERRTNLGGLTTSIRRNGLWFDNGQHVFLRCCTEYRRLLDRINGSSQVFLQRRLDVPVLAPNGVMASIRRSRLPAPLHLAASLARYRHLSIRQRGRLLTAAAALLRLDPDDDALDEISFGQWLAGRRQSDRAVDRLWNLIALPTLNASADEASLKLAVKVFRVGLLDRSDAGDIGWSSVPLAELHGGNARRALEAAGVEILTGSAVTSLERSSAGTYTLATDLRRVAVDAVVVGTPPRTAATLGAFDDVAADGLGASPIVNVHLLLDRRVTDLRFAACVDSPIQFVFDRTASSGATAGQCLAISLSAADGYIGRGSPELIQFFMAALAEVFPAAGRARLLDAVVTRERAATFRAAPGSDALRPLGATKQPGLFLAGAWCDTGWPATMEGAVRSGSDAARSALGFLGGRPATLVRHLEEAIP
ncbi:MAG: hydroxysqualene dehydroxylase HpnE [Acidimicrobiales bacterium]